VATDSVALTLTPLSCAHPPPPPAQPVKFAMAYTVGNVFMLSRCAIRPRHGWMESDGWNGQELEGSVPTDGMGRS
jgi:hypothetical protein